MITWKTWIITGIISIGILNPYGAMGQDLTGTLNLCLNPDTEHVVQNIDEPNNKDGYAVICTSNEKIGDASKTTLYRYEDGEIANVVTLFLSPSGNRMIGLLRPNSNGIPDRTVFSLNGRMFGKWIGNPDPVLVKGMRADIKLLLDFVDKPDLIKF